MRKNEPSEAAKTAFAEMIRQREERERALPQVRKEGAEALARLMKVAQGHSGQCKVVANFLLSCYNGTRFKFDLTDFRMLDYALFDDCLRVLRMDFQPQMEVHMYFENGGQLFEQLASDWGITDYRKLQDKEAL